MRLTDHKNSKKQGDVGVGVAIGWFVSQGYTVSVPLTDSQDYDLVVDIDGLQRVQVKTTTHRTKYGRFEVNLKVCGGNRSGTGRVKLFNGSSVDFVFILTSDWDKYLVPSSVVGGRTAITLGAKYEQYRINEAPAPHTGL